MQTFKEIERADDYVVYEYRTALGYIMYGTIGVWLFCVVEGNLATLEYLAYGLIVIYFLVIYLPSRKRSKIIREAMRTQGITMSGSRWSFSDPLKVRVTIGGESDDQTAA